MTGPYTERHPHTAGSHSDSPALKIKVNPEMKGNGYVKLNVEKYGGDLRYRLSEKSGRSLLFQFSGKQRRGDQNHKMTGA